MTSGDPPGERGTDERVWRDWPFLAELPRVDPTRYGDIVVVAAHPADEVLGFGGCLARLALLGTRLRLVAVTDGESAGGDGGSAEHAAARHRTETAAALYRLGAPDAEVVRFGLPDIDVDRYERQLAEALRTEVAGFDLCVTTWQGDALADHGATGRATAAACGESGVSFVRFPVWMWQWAHPDDPRVPWDHAVRVDLDDAARARKQAAIGCFGGRIRPPGEAGRAAPPPDLAYFERPFEVLFR